MKTLFSILSISIFLLIGCSKKDTTPSNNDILIFGSFAGECADNCAQYYKIEDGKLYADDQVEYGIPDDIPFQATPLPNEQYELVKDLLADFPADLLNSDKLIYGCPDCYDQGGIYLELRVKNELTKWQIDTDDTEQSEAIIAYKERLFDLLIQLQ